MDELASNDGVGLGGQDWREMINENDLLFSNLARNKRERQGRRVAC